VDRRRGVPARHPLRPEVGGLQSEHLLRATPSGSSSSWRSADSPERSPRLPAATSAPAMMYGQLAPAAAPLQARASSGGASRAKGAAGGAGLQQRPDAAVAAREAAGARRGCSQAGRPGRPGHLRPVGAMRLRVTPIKAGGRAGKACRYIRPACHCCVMGWRALQAHLPPAARSKAQRVARPAPRPECHTPRLECPPHPTPHTLQAEHAQRHRQSAHWPRSQPPPAAAAGTPAAAAGPAGLQSQRRDRCAAEHRAGAGPAQAPAGRAAAGARCCCHRCGR
jgi:hypothetical protein